MKNNEISVYCWHCGNRFVIKISNVYAGHLFCSEKCRIANFREEIKLKKKGGEKGE